MQTLPTTMLLIGFGLIGLLASAKDAAGRSKRSNQHAHSHGHSHSHSHDHGPTSPFTFGLGLSISQGFGGGSEEDGGSEEAHGHSHGLRGYALHEGHSHDAGGGEEAEASGGPATEISATAGYRLSKTMGLNLGLGFSPDFGIGDPIVGGTYTRKLPRRMSLGTTLSASLPVSDASQESYKITTVSLSSGPTWGFKRYTFSAKGKVAMSYYSKTVIVEEEEEHAAGLRLQEHDHDHGGEGEEHVVETTEAGTGVREFNRYGVNGTVGYRWKKQWNFSCGLGAAYVTHQFGPSLIETNATIAQGTYSWQSLSASLGLLTSSSDESLSLPTQPGFSAGLFYLYE